MREWSPSEIRALRLRLGYTQAEMAGVLSYGHATSVSALERGVKRPLGPVRRLLGHLARTGGATADPAPPKQWPAAEIRGLRVRLGLSQADLADALGYAHEESVSALERGVSQLGGAARRLLDLLDAGALDME